MGTRKKNAVSLRGVSPVTLGRTLKFALELIGAMRSRNAANAKRHLRRLSTDPALVGMIADLAMAPVERTFSMTFDRKMFRSASALEREHGYDEHCVDERLGYCSSWKPDRSRKAMPNCEGQHEIRVQEFVHPYDQAEAEAWGEKNGGWLVATHVEGVQVARAYPELQMQDRIVCLGSTYRSVESFEQTDTEYLGKMVLTSRRGCRRINVQDVPQYPQNKWPCRYLVLYVR